ncbi:nSTAND1 domain-containing NTPase [Streptomyces sp. AMCC400023]|uniref:nSTAND1 domain-containing NTPase n=1 Tax=Streptomyces sp. AMCC400023 TaxID=2056258 RepID=UPI001F398B33|nr:cytochrome D1 domain-containing protein [Streptomyces sp. AMCC400023]UJV43661.1 hypothetical protein CVT30_30895 [Streptomyces sp. AMCC400023]
MSAPETPPPGGEERRLEARASEGARVYQAGRDQHIAQRDLHLHYEDGVRRSRRAAPEAPAGECPYPGLAAFDENQACWFFGRDSVTAELLVRLDEQLREGGALAVVAPSGAGKSSLLRAGLLPALARGALPAAGSAAWPRLLLTPGAHPVATLTACLAEATGASEQEVTDAMAAGPQACVTLVRAVAGGDGRAAGRQLVLVVDQLEELFTLCTSERERRDFIAVLTALADAGPDSGPAALVAYGLRSDFYTPCADYPQLRAVLQNGQLVVGPMTRTELREATLFPARAVGLEIEPGLVELLLRDLGIDVDSPLGSAGAARGYEAGRLPLLAHALRATWQQRHGHTLTVDGYQATGGIRHAVATTAERLYTSLTPAQQQSARTLFLRLVKIGDGVDDTRRRLPYTDLLDASEDPAATAAVIDAYTRGRLLTRHQDTVEITHEALLHAWPELRRWIDTDRAGHFIRQNLEEAAADWDRAHRDPGRLYRGHRLEEARAWADRSRQNQPSLTAIVFLTASTKAQTRTTRRRQALTTALTVLLLLAVAAASLAFWQRQDALTQRQAALTAQEQALSRQLAAQSDALIDTDPDLASLLALQAYRTSPTTEATASLYTAADLPLQHRLTGHKDRVTSASFSRDGRTLATGSYDGTVRLWETATGRLRTTLTLTDLPEALISVSFSPDGRTLATGSDDDDTVQLWDTATNRLRITLTGHKEGVTSVSFSRDGRTLATGSGDGTVRLWDTATSRLRTTLTGHSSGVISVAFSPDRHVLATGSYDGTVRLWETATGRLRNTLTLTDLPEALISVSFSPDGRTLATGSYDRTVRLWETATGRLRTTLTADGTVFSVSFSPDGRTLVTSGFNSTVQVWDMSTRDLQSSLTGHDSAVFSVSFSRDGRTLATASADGTVRLWDTAASRLRTTLTGHKGDVASVSFSRDGRMLATGSRDGKVRLWDTATSRLRTTLTGHKGDVASVSFSRDGRMLATASADGTVRLWDTATSRLRATLMGHEDQVLSMAFSRDGRMLATGSRDGTVRLWDTARGRLRTTLTAPQGISSVAFSQDGRTLATGSGVGTVRIRDKPTGRLRVIPTGHDAAVASMAISSDGRTLATTGFDRTVRLWSIAANRTLITFTGHADQVMSMTFSPDGRTLATGSFNNAVRLWDVSTGRFRTALAGHDSIVLSVAFSPDGRTLATGGDDNTVRLWDVELPDQAAAIKKICTAVGRDLTAEERATHLPGQSSGPVCRS